MRSVRLALGHADREQMVGDPDNTDFSDAFCEFVQGAVADVNAAELLLVLHADPGRTWTARELAVKLAPAASVSEVDVAKYLETFQQRGLIGRADDVGVRYHPASPERDAHVRTLAKLYNERPVTLIRVIYTLRDTKIKTFADAFKIWRR